MPTVDIGGIAVDLTPAAAAVAQQWMVPLQTAAKALVTASAQVEARIQPALATAQLGPVMRGLVDLLRQATSLLQQSGAVAVDSSPPLLASVQDLITRYIQGLLEALERLLRDWEKLGPIFFTGSSGSQYKLVALASIDPLDDAIHQGGRASLIFHFQLLSLLDTTNTPIDGSLVYLPRDVERDFVLMGSSAQLCSSSGSYVFSETPCGHPWCQSMAARVNLQIGEPDAIPTYLVWPACPASTLGLVTTGAYGYREYLRSGTPEDMLVASDRAPEAKAFYRTLGRQVALAYTFCLRRVTTSGFVIHRLRPFWIGLAYAFEVPLASVRETGMFDAGLGPLAPPARAPNPPSSTAPAATPFGLAIQPATGSKSPPVPLKAAAFIEEVKAGCKEAFEALAVLSHELGNRFLLGKDLISWYRPRVEADIRDRQGSIIELLSTIDSWTDWGSIDGLVTEWRAEDTEAWTQFWFGLVFKKLPATTSGHKLSPDAAELLTPLCDRITGALGVRTLQEIKLEGILALSPADRESVWCDMVQMADLFSGIQEGTGWDPRLETRWGAVPSTALIEFELADHTSARFPYFVRRLQSASLWSEEKSKEVHLQQIPDAPPPRVTRDTYFPSPMAPILAERIAALKNAGIQIRLTSEIPALMTGTASGPTPPS